MTAAAALYGRLGRDPDPRTSQSGNPWATASIAVALGDDDAPPMWFNVIAFGRTAEVLCKHAKGDLLSVSGRLQMNRWRGQDGAEREQLQIVADSIVSAKGVRPSGGRRNGATDRADED